MGIIRRLLRIEEGEGGKSALFFFAFFSGVSSMILGRTIGDTLFLSRSNPGFLPYLYMGTAILTGLISMLYSTLLERVGRALLIPAITIMFLISVASMRLFFAFNPSVSYPIFVIWVEVIGTILVLQFWIIANDAFTSREARRLFPLITAGGLLGNVLCGLTVHSFVHKLGTENLLFVCAAMIGFYLLLIAPSLRKSDQHPKVMPAPNRPSSGAGSGLRLAQTSTDLFRSKYLRQVGGVILLTYLVSTLVDYQFKMTVKNAYTEEGMAAFFGWFYALIGLLSFLLQFFLTTRIMEILGVLPSLLLLPISILIGSLGFSVRPSFPVSVGVKSADLSLRYTVQYASLQILYLPFPLRMKQRVTSLLDGVIKPMSMGLGGLLLLGLIGILPLKKIALVSSALTLLWILLTITLRREYIASLLMTLRAKRLDLGSAHISSLDTQTAQALLYALQSNDEQQVMYAMDMLHQFNWKDLQNHLPSLASHASHYVRARALSYLSDTGDPSLGPLIEKGLNDPEPEVKESAINALAGIGKAYGLKRLQVLLEDPNPYVVKTAIVSLISRFGIDGFLMAAPAIKSLLESADENRRKAAAQTLAGIGIQHFYQPLVDLLSDPSPEVQREAILACGKIRNPVLVYHLLSRLAVRKLRASAIQALAAYGEDILEILSDTLKNDGDYRIRSAIPRVLSVIGTKKTLSVLVGCLDEPNHSLRQSIIRGISRIHVKYPNYSIPQEPVERKLMDTLKEYYYSLILFSALREKEGRLIGDTLKERMASLLEGAFLLLGILYPSRTMATVFANIKSQVPAERANAIEVLDALLPREIKAVLLPIIENRPLEDRLKIGIEHFQLLTFPHEDALRQLVEDYSAWVRACALYTIGIEKIQGLKEHILRGARDYEPIVKETAQSIMSRWGISQSEGANADNN